MRGNEFVVCLWCEAVGAKAISELEILDYREHIDGDVAANEYRVTSDG